jgi:hypothetical protein
MVGLWLLAGFAWWVRYFPPGTGLTVIDDDARQHVYWTARFQDPGLFPNDPLTDFIASPIFDPVGYQWLYRLGTAFMDPLPWSRLLTLVLLLLSLWLLDRLLGRLDVTDARCRFFCGVMLLFFYLYAYAGGFPRTLALPLLLGFLAQQAAARYRVAAGLTVVQALLYPPVVINSLAVAGWAWAGRGLRDARGRRWLVDGLAVVAAFAVVAGIYAGFYGAGGETGYPGPRVTLEQARQMPEFHEDGRSTFFHDSPWDYALSSRTGLVYIWGFLAIFLITGAFKGLRRLRLPRLAGDVILTSFLVYVLAWLVLFRLHLPARYVMYTVPLALIAAIGANAREFFDGAERVCRAAGRTLPGPRIRRALAAALVLAVLSGYGALQSLVINRFDTQVAVLDRFDREMLEHLRKLPRDALIAGHPLVMDNVPLFSRRSVMANRELSIPYYVGYYRRVRDRLRDMLEGYYAAGWEGVADLRRQYGVDAVVVRKSDFRGEPATRGIYYEPFDSEIRREIRRRREFALEDPPAGRVRFENRRYRVVDLRPETGKRRESGGEGPASRVRPASICP